MKERCRFVVPNTNFHLHSEQVGTEIPNMPCENEMKQCFKMLVKPSSVGFKHLKGAYVE